MSKLTRFLRNPFRRSASTSRDPSKPFGLPADSKGRTSRIVILPNEDIFAIPSDIDRVRDLKTAIEEALAIPCAVQRLILVSAELEDEERIEDLPRYLAIELVIAVGGSYTIHRQGLAGLAEIMSGDTLVPHASHLASRSLERLAAGSKLNLNAPAPVGQGEKPAPHESAIAETYFESFNANRERRLSKIRKAVRRLDTGPIVVSMFNNGFAALLENWAASCDLNGIDCRSFSLLFPSDEKADKRARELGFQTFFDGVSYGDISVEAVGSFGDIEFRRLLFAKLAMTKDMLDVGSDVIRQDVDIVWQRDPRTYLASRAEREGLDMLFMHDGPNPTHQPLHYNTGFALIRSNPFTRHAWDTVFSNYAMIFAQGGEQHVVNVVLNCLRERGLRTVRLDDDLFVNGHIMSDVLHGRREKLPETAAVVHASWTRDLTTKIDHMKTFGLWHL